LYHNSKTNIPFSVKALESDAFDDEVDFSHKCLKTSTVNGLVDFSPAATGSLSKCAK